MIQPTVVNANKRINVSWTPEAQTLLRYNICMAHFYFLIVVGFPPVCYKPVALPGLC